MAIIIFFFLESCLKFRVFKQVVAKRLGRKLYLDFMLLLPLFQCLIRINLFLNKVLDCVVVSNIVFAWDATQRVKMWQIFSLIILSHAHGRTAIHITSASDCKFMLKRVSFIFYCLCIVRLQLYIIIITCYLHIIRWKILLNCCCELKLNVLLQEIIVITVLLLFFGLIFFSVTNLNGMPFESF